MIDIRQLRSLIAIVETGNLSRAAQRLNLSQPALSHQIKQWEEQLGAELFERKSRPIKVSPRCRSAGVSGAL